MPNTMLGNALGSMLTESDVFVPDAMLGNVFGLVLTARECCFVTSDFGTRPSAKNNLCVGLNWMKNVYHYHLPASVSIEDNGYQFQ